MPTPVENVSAHSTSLPEPGLGRSILLWGVLFLICLGLGYPTLNRYDPRQSLPDSASYCRLVTEGPSTVEGYFRFRVLEPYMVRPIYLLAKGHVGSWDPVLFGFLIVNAFFVACTAYLSSVMGYAHFGDRPMALVGTALYLLNFAVPNAQLAGLVDAGEGFFLMALVVSMFFERWWLLPILGILGALTKESLVPFSIVMAMTWWILLKSSKASRPSSGFWLAPMAIISMAIAEFVTITLLQSSILGHLAWPWSFAAGLNSHTSYFASFMLSLVDRSSWYILIWLLPLGLQRIRQFSRPWVWAAAAASVVALLLNAYHTLPGVGGGVGRCIFNIAGPLLSLSVGGFLCDAKPRSGMERPV